MGLRNDLSRFRKVGDEKRMDLTEYINHRDLAGGRRNIKIPIKIINLPEFTYDPWDMGGVGQGEGEPGDPVPGEPQEGEGEEGEPGEESGEHGYYDMDPEEFAKEMDEELGLDLDPKGKQVKEEVEGHLVEMARSGPDSTLDFERMYKKGLKRSLSFFFDEDYLKDVLRVDGVGPQKAFEWARNNNMNVSRGWIDAEYEKVPKSELSLYDSIEDIPGEPRQQPTAREIESVALRNEDKRHKYPEITHEYEKNAVIVFIRDVSGSMGNTKRELVERVFTPMDWYLTGKYEKAEFLYIAHDSSAWEVSRDDFFGIQSGGGTRISSAYELTEELFEGVYPFNEWNRYVFAAGDGENFQKDTKENVIPLMENIDANLHGYLEVSPNSSNAWGGADHADTVEDYFGEDHDSVAVARVKERDDVMDAVYEILSTEDNDND